MDRSRLALALVPAMVVPFLAALLYFVLLGEHPVARAVYSATKVFTMLWPLLCVTWLLGQGMPRPAWHDRRHLRAVPGGLVLGALVVAAVMLLFDSPVGAVAIDSAPRIRARAASLGIVEHYWTFALFLSLLHSLVEEYYWRWFVYGQLRRVLSAGPATLLASAAFTAHHVVIASQYFPLAWAAAGRWHRA